MAEISIIMPAFNAELYIRKTMDSIINQSFKDWDLIIVNDGSTDGTEKIIADYCIKYPMISYRNIKNTGSARIPRLTAAALSNSKWLCNIDSDDIIEERYLEKLLGRAEMTGADIITPIMEYTENGVVCSTVPSSSFDFSQVIDGKEAAFLTFKNGTGSMIACNGILCRRELYACVIPDLKEKDVKYVYQDEVDFLKILLHAQKVAFSDAKYSYIKNTASVTHQVSVKTYDKLLTEIEYRNIVKEYFDDNQVIKIMNRRLLDTIIRRRFKFLMEKKYFSKDDEIRIEKMFELAYSQLDRKIAYSWAKKIFCVLGGYRFFKINAYLIYVIKYK